MHRANMQMNQKWYSDAARDLRGWDREQVGVGCPSQMTKQTSVYLCRRQSIPLTALS